jgi:hypothetical protein
MAVVPLFNINYDAPLCFLRDVHSGTTEAPASYDGRTTLRADVNADSYPRVYVSVWTVCVCVLPT